MDLQIWRKKDMQKWIRKKAEIVICYPCSMLLLTLQHIHPFPTIATELVSLLPPSAGEESEQTKSDHTK